ncbi:hypothetical protein AB0C33_47525 [Nonomuraea sp. NPDC048881]|uniref:hypothetical protein n=1 Tax=Nonomuraea sp. NPDC048881 TaxID=3155030 RepID=UPI003408F5A2
MQRSKARPSSLRQLVVATSPTSASTFSRVAATSSCTASQVSAPSKNACGSYWWTYILPTNGQAAGTPSADSVTAAPAPAMRASRASPAAFTASSRWRRSRRPARW